MDAPQQRHLIDEATFAHTMGDSDQAIALLAQVIDANPDSFDAWHTLAEVHFANGNYPAAGDAGLSALAIKEDDVHLHTSLSRIFMELGDKDTAEKHGARARVLGWKAELHGEQD